MEWKKIVSVEYGKIIFHPIPYHALTTVINNNINVDNQGARLPSIQIFVN